MKDRAVLDRRQLIQSAMLLVGMAIVPSAVSAASADTPGVATLGPLSRALVIALSDAIIPRTDTPGAVDAKVPALFEELLDKWASPQSRTQLLDGLAEINSAARSSRGRGFADLDDARRQSVLAMFDEGGAKNTPIFATIKMLIVSLYYMSEPGSTAELRYEHVPGRWDPSLPVTPETRTQGGA
ncbi:gluconate 2-dehydrogenase subunit 3 family protein [Sphingobium boeckii]|uniref:Gluconate 2-dehydrogenase subunit 3 family protein n=1 Tax=Sphingobium boeckii TaxID=1082345 RepID=A0A7W9AHH6_9SPHN|nr:gluconate 2-dehydrogenase subunit 3 family protein [Sphingobium boeckii]MBB5685663.1 hypothetical protein [Sphingobium boeckii]